jgi:hypothetical protein
VLARIRDALANANRNRDDCIDGDTQAAHAAQDDEVIDGESEAIQ